MKVGIVSCYYHHNYGSMLQAYATQKIIKKIGCEPITINCLSPINYMTQSKVKYYWHKLTNVGIVKTKIRQYKSIKTIKNYPEVLKGRKIRDLYFDEFYRRFINLTDANYTRKDLEKTVSSFSAVVVGSDMLWHPINVEHDYYTLTFVPDTVKKVAYATSFGTTHIPSYQLKKYREFLQRFYAISVREQSGVQVIEQLNIGKKVEVVLDPTLLFTGEEWMDIQEMQPVENGKYIFCYLLGVNKEHREFVEKLKKKTGYKIVALQHLDEFVETDVNFADVTPYNVGPSEFVNLIRNAEFVCTDSFHGTCFSILNHKKFYTFNRFNSNSTQSTNTRIDSLLGLVGLENRRIASVVDFDHALNMLDVAIDYQPIDAILNKVRYHSIEYLKKALLDEGGIK